MPRHHRKTLKDYCEYEYLIEINFHANRIVIWCAHLRPAVLLLSLYLGQNFQWQNAGPDQRSLADHLLALWYMSKISVLRRCRQKDKEFEDSCKYIVGWKTNLDHVRPYFKIKINKTK